MFAFAFAYVCGSAARSRGRERSSAIRTLTFGRRGSSQIRATASACPPPRIDAAQSASSSTDSSTSNCRWQHRADERNIKRNLQWWKEKAGFVSLDKLTSQTFSGLRSRLLARSVGRGIRTKPVTQAPVNRYLAALSAVCKCARKELHRLPANPVLSVATGKESTGIIRLPADDKRNALLEVCKAGADPNIHCAIALALATGSRYSNLRMR
jgi:hypothetical protein